MGRVRLLGKRCGCPFAVLLAAVLVILVGCTTGAGKARQPVAPEPEVSPAIWRFVEQDILLASAAARADAAAYAHTAIDHWMGRVRRYTDEAFIPWYTSYWTQEWLAVKVALSRSGGVEGDDAAVRKLAGYLQEKYVSQVLEPASRETDPTGILHQATAMYMHALRNQVEAIGKRYRLPDNAYRNRLDRIPTISVGGAQALNASLGRLVQTREWSDLSAYAALVEQIESDGVDVTARLSKERLSPIASAVAETFVRKIATRGGAAAAAAAVGGPGGLAVSLGITGWGIVQHNKHKPELEAQLREVMGPALDQMQRDLLEDPRHGVLGVVNHVDGQIRYALRVPPTETGQPLYEDLW